MVFPWFVFSIFFFSIVQHSSAYGERGIAERAQYYVAYLAEWELHQLDKSKPLTIAPGCVGKGGGRCNFDELALYIWASRNESKKPTGFKTNRETKINTLENLDATSSFNKFIGKIERARFNTDEFLNGEIDVNKLMPGKSNFYDCLSSMGDPIGALAAELDEREKTPTKPGESAFKRTKEQEKALQWGKATAFYVSVLRGKDQDKYRRSFFEKYFEKNFPDKKIVIETMNVETPMDEKELEEDKTKRKGMVPKWVSKKVPLIDFAETIKKNKDKLEGFEEELEKANAEFMAKETKTDGKVEKFNEAHKKALAASKMATTATGCTRELPRELKRRDPLAELSLRSPKAAKSVRVKARKLGFTL